MDHRGTEPVQLRITLAHRRVDVIELPAAPLRRGSSSCQRARTAALESWRSGIDDRIAATARELAAAYDEGRGATERLGQHRFQHADALLAAEAHLAEIDTVLEASVDTVRVSVVAGAGRSGSDMNG